MSKETQEPYRARMREFVIVSLVVARIAKRSM